MKYMRAAIWLLLIPLFSFGALASLEPSEGAPFHAGWLAFYSGAILITMFLLAREFLPKSQLKKDEPDQIA